MTKVSIGWLWFMLLAVHFVWAQNDSIRIQYYTYNPHILCPKDTLTITYTINNTFPETQLVSLGAILQADSLVVEDKARVKLALVPPGLWRCSRSFVIPENAANQTYDLLATLYDGMTAKELSRNTIYNGIRILYATDLMVTAAQDTLVSTIVDSLQINCLVVNQGRAACPSFAMDYYLSSHQSGTEYLLAKTFHDRICPANAPSGCFKKKISLILPLPESIAAGTYYITVVIDNSSLPWERILTNNSASFMVMVRESNPQK
jgi:hypothetical protein